MAQLTQVQQNMIEVLRNYKQSSRAVVIMFEQTIDAYYKTDSMQPHNIEFMINAMKGMPILQKTAITLLRQKGEDALVYVTITKNKDKEGHFTVKRQEKVSPTEKGIGRNNLSKFIAAQHNSLMTDKTVKVKGWDQEQAAKSFKSSIESMLKKFLAENPDADTAIIQKIASDTMEAAFDKGNVKKLREAARSKAA